MDFNLNTCVSTLLARSPEHHQVLGLRSGNLTAELLVTRQTAWLEAELAGYSYGMSLLESQAILERITWTNGNIKKGTNYR